MALAGGARGGRREIFTAGAGVLGAAIAASVGAVLAVSALAATPDSARYLDGPPPGFSGGFGEESCHACHFSEEVNASGGTLKIEGVPDRYVAGERYPIIVSLTRPGMAMAGFQLSARFTDDGRQAGELGVPDGEQDRVGVGEGSEIQYAFQRIGGSRPAESGRTEWPIVWVAPESGGSVSFHAAANAANGDDSAEGDFVYTSDATSLSPTH